MQIPSFDIYLKNENILLSENVQEFNNMQYGPFMLEGKGDVSMYVAHKKINNKWMGNRGNLYTCA